MKRSIFEECNFINESYDSSSIRYDGGDLEFYDIPLSEGTYITNCDIFVTDDMINECCGDRNLIEYSALLEGAKIDLALQNFLKEGKDYKGLKKDVKDIIKANDLDPDNYRSKGKGFMHVCKRILQVCEDIAVPLGIGTDVASIAGGLKMASKANAAAAAFGLASVAVSPMTIVINGIITLVISFIINRLFRYLLDTIEFNTIKEDAIDVVRDLRISASKANDPKIAEKFNKEADRLEESIKKYSKKNNK